MTIENANYGLESSLGFVCIEPSDRRWVSFLDSQPHATIFHHPAWIRLLAECYGYRPFVITACDDAGNIQAGIPIAEIRSWPTGLRWVSLPFSDYCNPLFSDHVSLTRLTKELTRLAQEKDAPEIELRWEYPGNDSIHTTSRYVLHTLELHSDVEKVLRNIHRTQYQNVRRAEKAGVRIERGRSLADMRTFHRLQRITRRRHGLPVQPWRFFELLFHHVIEKDLGIILLASYAGRYLAAGVFLYTRQTLSYKYAASDNEGQDLRPNHLLTWSAISWACANGFRRFDFGRSDIDDLGLRTFKLRWGAEESTLPYSYFSALPMRQRTSKFMPLMKSVILRSPEWMGTMIGEWFYKYFA